ELPPWWPVALTDGAVARPPVLELVGETGSGRLSLALSWLAAARPALAAVIDTIPGSLPLTRSAGVPDRSGRSGPAEAAGLAGEHGGHSGDRPARRSTDRQGRFYPPAAASAGV